jgi:hypothetical protein
MANTANFSRGDTFGCSWTWTPGAGQPANLIGTTITSTLRDHCGDEYAMTVTLAGNGLSFTTNYPGDTSDWALGQANWDIRFVFPGSPTTHSTIFRVIIEQTITQS